MALTKVGARIRLDMINNYVTESEKAARDTDRKYWLQRARAERNELKRKISIEKFLDDVFGPDDKNGS